MAIYVVRTTVGREDQVLDFLKSNAKKVKGIYALLHPYGMAGYILVEAISPDIVKSAATGIPYVSGILRTPLTMPEIQHLIEFKPEEINIQKGDIVTIIDGPFKGEKAKVTRVDLQKAQIIVELLEAAVPIPITLTIDAVKVQVKAESETENKEKGG
ncbi:MAG: transcription elongation factor Spt5 [Candidatus Nanoarchaeia archaeon]